MTRPLAVALALLLAASAAIAAPRDEALRIAPTDTALVIVVQDARTHVANLITSPFTKWLPSSAIGKKIRESSDLKKFEETAGLIQAQLGIAPTSLLDDVFGDAVVFAFSPGGNGAEERAVLIIRPRKTEALVKLVDRVNELQKLSGEIKEVVRKSHRDAAFFERQKAAGGSDFYCFRNGAFIFTGSEAEIKAAIERAQTAPPASEVAPELLKRIKALGVADAAAVLLINPRAFDAEVKSQLESAKPDEKRFLARFSELWTAVEHAAVFLALDKDLELGVSVRFHEDKLPAKMKPWLAGRQPATAANLIPERVLFGIAGHSRARDLIDFVTSMAPLEPGKPDVKSWIEGTLGPIVGKDQLPRVIDALGPNWAAWAEPPAKGDVLPVFVAAIELQADPESRGRLEKSLSEALEFGFKTARVAYNAMHADQIEVKQDKDPRTGAIITSLVNDKGFPPGFRPSFAITNGYIVLATSPDAIRRVNSPASSNSRPDETGRLARFSANETRSYLLAHGNELASLLARNGIGSEKQLAEQFASLSTVLELLESVDLTFHTERNSLRVSTRISFCKPLRAAR